MQIWKTPVNAFPGQAMLSLPRGARPLSVQLQHGIPTMWWLVEPTYLKESRVVTIVGTGSSFDPDGLTFVGTVQCLDGLVWHYWVRP